MLVLLAVVLGMALYFVPTKPPAQTLSDEEKDFSSSLENEGKKISGEQKIFFQSLEKKYADAVSLNTETAWLDAASGFLKGARFSQNDSKALYYKGAIVCFEKALEINPGNISAKTNLGTCIVESSALLGIQPMKGINLLREAVQQDSANIDAHLQLGIFSVTSRQFDKAIERFEKILTIDSSRIDMYVYLGDTHRAMGDKPKAIESYERYKSQVADTLIQNDIEEYIKKLKQ